MTPATGYALREQNQPFADEPAWTSVEVDLQRAGAPLREKPYLADFAFEYVSVHCLELSVSSPEPPATRYLDEILSVAVENGADAISDHLGFTHGRPGGPSIGHVTAPPFTAEALDVTCRNVEFIQRRFGHCRFYLENLAHSFLLKGRMSEAEFMARMLERTGCGLLLDVTNAYANQQNFGIDAADFLREVVPAAASVQMHLAGGYFDETTGRYIDSHSHPIPDEVWGLYRLALKLGRGRIAAVFIERDIDFPDEAGWRGEVRRARQLAADAEARP